MNFTKTLDFIKVAHVGQHYGDKPYWTHPLEVSEAGLMLFKNKFGEDEQKAALLHDVIEDTEYTLEDLTEMGFNDNVVASVDLLTHKGGSYQGYIKALISTRNKTAMMVKMADNHVNFTGDKSSWTKEKRDRKQAQYRRSIEQLSKALGVRYDFPPEN